MPGAGILLVDTDLPLLRAVQACLETLSEGCVFAQSYDEAIEALDRSSFDVAVIAAELSPKSGAQLVRAVRASWPSVRTILMSEMDPDASACIASITGADATLSKPFEPDALRTLAGELMARPAAERSSQPPPPRAPRASPSMARILIVEDEVVLARVLRDTLSETGYTCAIACDYELALELLGNDTFDIALVNRRLPLRSGVELLSEIHRRWPAVVTILMSGVDPVSLAALAEVARASAYLPKPFDINELHRVLRRAGTSSGTHSRLAIEEAAPSSSRRSS